MSFKKMIDLDLKGKRVLIREDLNVPIDENGKITSEARIIAAAPTIKRALEQNACVIVISHLGRPKEGAYDPKLSLLPVAKRLGETLGVQVPLIKAWLNGVDVKPGKVVLCEECALQCG